MRAKLVTRACILAALVGAAVACESPPPPCPPSPFATTIPVPATNEMLTVPFRVTASTAPGTGGASFSVRDNVGTFRVGTGDDLPAFVYARQTWSSIRKDVFAALAVEDGVWHPFWFYCDGRGALTDLFAERTDDDTLLSLPVGGTCLDDSTVAFQMPLALPAHELRNVNMTCGFSVVDSTRPFFDVDRGALDLQPGQPGEVQFGLNDWAHVLVFAAVDCRTHCGSPGWVELHSVVWDPPSAQVGLFLWYLTPGSAGARIDNSLLLPAVAPVMQSFPNATFDLTR